MSIAHRLLLERIQHTSRSTPISKEAAARRVKTVIARVMLTAGQSARMAQLAIGGQHGALVEHGVVADGYTE